MTTEPEAAFCERLLECVVADPICAEILDRMPTLDVPDWWLTAGAVFQNVWNNLVGKPPGHGIKDYDVFYFDAQDLSWEAEDEVIAAAADLFDDLSAIIEVRNEARVHLWYESRFGVPAQPFLSARDAIDAFAATTCRVGVTRGDNDLVVHAPYGLKDLFDLRMVPNPRLAPRDVYERKVESYRQRRPSLTALAWPH